jgi:RNA polymerase sigma-70 factor (ECF subfamily)
VNLERISRLPAASGLEMPPPSTAPGPGSWEAERMLLADLRAGESEAFETLVRAHAPRLLSVARRYFRSEEDARDAVQEAFISAFKSIARFKGDSSLSTWLHRITVNAALMKIRSGARRPETSIEELLPKFDQDGHHASAIQEWPESAEEIVFRDETRARVREAIEKLPETFRTVLLLRDIEELDTDEVARMLNVTPNAVKIRLHRARQALRTLLDPIVGGSDS